MCPNTCASYTICSLNRYNVKGQLDYFDCKTGVFLTLFISMFTKKSDHDKKINWSTGNFNNYEEKLSVPRVYIAALIESQATAP